MPCYNAMYDENYLKKQQQKDNNKEQYTSNIVVSLLLLLTPCHRVRPTDEYFEL